MDFKNFKKEYKQMKVENDRIKKQYKKELKEIDKQIVLEFSGSPLYIGKYIDIYKRKRQLVREILKEEWNDPKIEYATRLLD